MTPKEKAEELFSTYRYALSIPNAPFGEYKDNVAKQCALIAIDEMIRIAPWSGDIGNEIEDGSKEYYMKVKREIEKL